ncbi:MAG: hypothetical protein JXA96_14905, partial [Sedimentisphaerales bacterium]|nr:hypothetical protein [Sedimentisphaerales bacterium]
MMKKKYAKVKIVTLAVVLLCLVNTRIEARNDSAAAQSSIVQLPQGLSLEDQVYEDINLDGMKDLA